MGHINISTHSVSSQFLYRAFQSAQALGARKPVLLAALDLEESALRNPLRRFDMSSISAFCNAASHELGDPAIYDAIGHQMLPQGFSDIGYSAVFEQNFVKAVKWMIGAYHIVGSDQENTEIFGIEKQPEAERLIWNIPGVASPEFLHIVFANVFHFGEMLSSGRFQTVRAIYFKHSQPPHFAGIGTTGATNHIPCYFNAPQSYLEYYPGVLGQPNQMENRGIVSARKNQRADFQPIDHDTLSLARLSYYYLIYLLDKPGLNLDAAAQSFQVAERTMRRKLLAEGASFRQILENARRDTCQLYFLENTRSLGEIAAKLGYSELSAFTRAYTAWHGNPPSRDARSPRALAA
ncbi:helix-turn-helix domain-containing protein [Parasphingorhabdus halotolerans]|uniref:Helix-turn-helix domain-containing protein n=1 Tax=Parasphingorhabdus halotolerans TaxID=2725558 RepID=A0A6H2DN82_9SPHN|nr:helix-turn-helix domain-containing protein [Parasphingorhabdus halotolerans]QJB69415.1 helix-turn-helix domain-containing protein [Parasphingorhabdus halotolerans]